MNERKSAILDIATKAPVVYGEKAIYDINEEYGKDVFSQKVMEECLPKPVFKKLIETINTGAAIDSSIADDVAHAMKKWAQLKGVTHYTHWFLPLTGSTAEKHDSFLEPDSKGGAISRFSGKNLIVGEPDASSFPSGGIRSTFEARGYTAWDPTSPAFIRRVGGEATLCIPSAFCSYTGEILDRKTPILRSMQALAKQTKRVLKCFGIADCQPSVTLGAEQEYFLIDKALYLQRPDIRQTGRTLFGCPPQRHQQLEDHYFGSIKPSILSFMSDVDRKLWALGIPAKTRHNEVAPAQFEIAPMFEELNLAVDHNMLVMEVLRQTAEEHSLVCLLHEKPFAGVNGSGKHNNWSVSAAGINMLDPGNDPHQNAIFLTTLCAVIKAVDSHSDLLRSATAGAGNDHRLGANEAPPAIISMFLGDQLNDIIAQLEKGKASSSKQGKLMRVGVDILPPLPCDATDRNRTSPFAFTGNKFEFRAAGSSQSCSSPNVILNTIVSEAFDEIATILEAASPENFNDVLQGLLSDIIVKHKKIIFNGDNYTAEWKEEALKRGLPNLATTPEALTPLIDQANIDLFAKYGVFNNVEMHSRYEVFIEEYQRKIAIETGLSLRMARTHFIPAISKYVKDLSESYVAQKSAGIESVAQKSLLDELAKILEEVITLANDLEAKISSNSDVAIIIAAMSALRAKVDSAEPKLDDNLWPLPKYCEMLFIY